MPARRLPPFEVTSELPSRERDDLYRSVPGAFWCPAEVDQTAVTTNRWLMPPVVGHWSNCVPWMMVSPGTSTAIPLSRDLSISE